MVVQWRSKKPSALNAGLCLELLPFATAGWAVSDGKRRLGGKGAITAAGNDAFRELMSNLRIRPPGYLVFRLASRPGSQFLVVVRGRLTARLSSVLAADGEGCWERRWWRSDWATNPVPSLPGVRVLPACLRLAVAGGDGGGGGSGRGGYDINGDWSGRI